MGGGASRSELFLGRGKETWGRLYGPETSRSGAAQANRDGLFRQPDCGLCRDMLCRFGKVSTSATPSRLKLGAKVPIPPMEGVIPWLVVEPDHPVASGGRTAPLSGDNPVRTTAAATEKPLRLASYILESSGWPSGPLFFLFEPSFRQRSVATRLFDPSAVVSFDSQPLRTKSSLSLMVDTHSTLWPPHRARREEARHALEMHSAGNE